jgi:hypothetical protein
MHLEIKCLYWLLLSRTLLFSELDLCVSPSTLDQADEMITTEILNKASIHKHYIIFVE